MKNKRIFIIILFMIVIILITIFVLIKYYPNSIEEKLMYKTWYQYDSLSGYYNTVYVEKDSFTYNKAGNTGVQEKYDSCTKYTFDKLKRLIILDCGEKISIDKIEKERIVLLLNNKKEIFFSNPEDSLNYEFENYFNKSRSEYKNQMTQNMELIKINYERFLEVTSEKENSKFVFLGNNCSSIECTIFLNVLEKWISTNENLYYIDINELDNKQLDTISKRIKDFNIDKDYYNDVYPKIVIINNNKVLDQYQIKCKGFNCNSYIKQ